MSKITSKEVKLFKEDTRIYFRESCGNYIVTKMDNGNTDNTAIAGRLEDPFKLAYAGITNNTPIFNSIYKLLNYYETSIDKRIIKSDIVDITDFNIVALTSKDTTSGIQEISFAKESRFLNENSGSPLPFINILFLFL